VGYKPVEPAKLMLKSSSKIKMKVLGIDLAGSERRNSGVAYLEDGKLTCFVLHKDEEILELSKGFPISS
jgi:hypothetical protein